MPRRPTIPLLFVAVSLSVMVTGLAINLAPLHPDNRGTFYSFTDSWSSYAQLRPEWRPRILPNVLAAGAERVGTAVASTERGQLPAAVAAWTFGWFLLVTLTLSVVVPERALLYMFGCFAGVAFGYMPGYDTRTYPWDLPILAVFMAFVLLHRAGRERALMFAIPAGMLFKETSIVLSLALLFSAAPWRQRVQRFAVAVGACLLVKIAIDLLVGVPVPILSMTASGGADMPSRWSENVAALLTFKTPRFDNVIFVNAGTLVAMLLLPNTLREVRMLKVIAVAFIGGLFVYGQVAEYRVWFEMIGPSLYAFELSSRAWGPMDRVQSTKYEVRSTKYGGNGDVSQHQDVGQLRAAGDR